MKTKLFLLISILSLNDNAAVKNNRIKESLLNVAEEVGAWVLTAGFFILIFRIAEMLF